MSTPYCYTIHFLPFLALSIFTFMSNADHGQEDRQSLCHTNVCGWAYTPHVNRCVNITLNPIQILKPFLWQDTWEKGVLKAKDVTLVEIVCLSTFQCLRCRLHAFMMDVTLTKVVKWTLDLLGYSFFFYPRLPSCVPIRCKLCLNPVQAVCQSGASST